MLVLGLETSCDETGVALYDSEQGLLADALFSQIDLHRVYGGVVPELASRDHVKRMLPLIRQILDEAGRKSSDIDAVAYTAGPGLVGALLVGASCAQAMAFAWGVPAVGVHHMEGHLLAPMLEDQPPAFPFVALLVSGGHTQLVRVDGIGRYELLGESVDDAAGEAFDKTAQLLGLGYPGGPALSELAVRGTPGKYRLPRPMIATGLDFSFSGLKTAVLSVLKNEKTNAADLARAFVDVIVEVLVAKCARAVEMTGITRLVVAGGVGANRQLRAALDAEGARRGFDVYYPEPELCTDNGAMIAFAAAFRIESGVRSHAFSVKPRWDLQH